MNIIREVILVEENRRSSHLAGFEDSRFVAHKANQENYWTKLCRLIKLDFHEKKERRINRIQLDDKQEFASGAKLVINVCGKRYEVAKGLLGRYPDTLLGDPVKLDKFYDPKKEEYYFNRTRECFSAILYYYQSGVLRRPEKVHLDTFLDEVSFYQLDKDAVLQFCRDEGFVPTPIYPLPSNRVQKKIWQLFDDPLSSLSARLISIFSLFIILVSITVFCVETLPQFKADETTSTNSSGREANRTLNGTRIFDRDYGQFKTPLFAIETTTIAWFVLEFVIRLSSCPEKITFVRSPLNIIDFLSILPYFADLGISLNTIDSANVDTGKASSLAIIKVLRLVRIFRVFKLTRHSKGLQILMRTFSESAHEMGLLLLFLAIGVILFSSAVYYAEQDVKDTQFDSIPGAFWWVIITMTTVGYGDFAPRGAFGKLVGSFCAVSGLVAIGLPVPFIVANFTTIYRRERDRPQMEEFLKGVLEMSSKNREVIIDFQEANNERSYSTTRRCPKRSLTQETNLSNM